MGTFLGPIIAIALFNMVIFVIVTVVVVRHKRGRQKHGLEKTTVYGTAKSVISIGGVTFLFGLAWILGALTFKSVLGTAFLYLFVILNAFQGFYLSVWLILLNEECRRVWRNILTCHKPDDKSWQTGSSRPTPAKSGAKSKSTQNSVISSKCPGSPVYKPQNGNKVFGEQIVSGDYDSSNETRNGSTKLAEEDLELGVLSSEERKNEPVSTVDNCHGQYNPIFESVLDGISPEELNGTGPAEKESQHDMEDGIKSPCYVESDPASTKAISLSSNSSQC